MRQLFIWKAAQHCQQQFLNLSYIMPAEVHGTFIICSCMWYFCFKKHLSCSKSHFRLSHHSTSTLLLARLPTAFWSIAVGTWGQALVLVRRSEVIAEVFSGVLHVFMVLTLCTKALSCWYQHVLVPVKENSDSTANNVLLYKSKET